MSQLISQTDNLHRAALEGMALAHQDLLQLDGNIIFNKQLLTRERVTVLTFAGAGLEPAPYGFVGEGMADAAVVGEVLAAPGPSDCGTALQIVDRGAGVLLVYMNRPGDALTANLLAKIAAQHDISFQAVAVHDNVGSAGPLEAGERDALVGYVAALKVAGAAACLGKYLAEVAELTQNFVDKLYTEALQLGEDGLLLGGNLEGEGGSLTAGGDVAAVAQALVRPILEQLPPGVEQVLVMVNGNGAATPAELYAIYREVFVLLAQRGIAVAKSFVGEFLGAGVQQGVQLCIVPVTEEELELLGASCETPGLMCK